FEAYGLGTDPTDRNNAISFGLNLLLLHSMGFLETLTWNGPSWSISVEYFTYLMFFLLTWAFRAYTAWVFAAVAAVSLGAIYVLAKMYGEHGILFTTDFGILRCFASFFTGAALYIGFRAKPWRLGRAAATALEAAVVIIVVFAVAHSFNNPEWQIVSVVGFGALIYVFASGGGLVSVIMNVRPIRYVGEISYSIYMVHAIVMIAVFNLCRYVLKMDIVFLGGEFPLIQTPYATLFNIPLLLVIIAMSALVYRWVEIRGKTWMYRAFSLR
ncbi:MAG: acyltransferase family protein, partial [Alphaproteobacteria bacterium]